MSRIVVASGLGLIALATVAALAVWSYRASKLAILEPRSLPIVHVKTGETTARCSLLMIGDSHIHRWPVTPPPGWRVEQLGFPGEAAVNIAATFPGALGKSAPDAVLIAAGTNDASAAALQGDGREAALDRAARAVERMIADARAAGAKRVIVATLVPPRHPELWRRLIYGSRQAAALTNLSNRIAARAKSGGAEIFDANALARDATGAFRRELRADALHWSSTGYDLLSKVLWRDLGVCRDETD